MYFPDTRSLAVIGTAAVTALAGAYVFFGPSDGGKRKRKGTCPGLINLGNTCFLNAILQAVAPCSTAVQWLEDFTAKRLSDGKYLASTLYSVLRVLNNDSIEHEDEYCPSDVIDALQAKRWVIPKDEQDAHELFHVLTQTLDEESTKYQPVLPLFDVKTLEDNNQENLYQDDEAARNRIQAQLPLLPKKESDHPFKGLLASQLQCKECHSKYPVKYDTFDSLSLNLPSNYAGPLNLDHLLKQYIMSETVNNVECEGCARKTGQENQPLPRTTFVKKLTIGKLPQCLCLHIQRTVWMNSGVPMKRLEHVAFPEVLNMGEYVYNSIEPRQQLFRPLHHPEGGEFGARLVGGRKNGLTKLNSSRTISSTSSPTLSVPYSGPVNVLKALNYHTRTTMTGLGASQDEPVEQSNSSVQRLAQVYSTETYSPINTSHAYKLSSVVVHLGDVFSGHFVTYRRRPSSLGQRFPNRWLYTSDTLVKRASPAEVLQADAYMLFYEKI